MEQEGLLLQAPTHSGSILKQMAISVVGGSLAGVTNCLIGHPLDTVKVNMQMSTLSLVNCMKTMYRQEGIRSFYRGITSPLGTAPIFYVIFVGSYELGRMIQGIGFHDEMSFSQGAFSGSLSGLATCAVLTPMELVKCKLQLEVKPQGIKHTTAMEMARKVFREEGIRGMYRGNVVTMFREVPGCAAHFALYEYTKIFLNRTLGDRYINLLLAGGIAGVSSWVISYPFDIVKTRIQVNLSGGKSFPVNRWMKDGGMISCAKDIWRAEGTKGFFRGFSACALRSFISEGFSFFVYETAKKKFDV